MRHLKMDLTADTLRSLYRYDEGSGQFYRFKSAGSERPVGYRTSDKYIGIVVNGYQYLAHRLAWLYVYGVWPSRQIDHINHIRSDNRIANLRDCTRAQNQANRVKGKNNTTGYKGVSKRNSKFHAVGIRGLFATPQEAKAAYDARKKSRHGDFFYSG